MKPTIDITVLTGPHKDRHFRFEAPVRCCVGRAEGCTIRLAGHEGDLQISRRHCEFDIDPPRMHLRDLGSLNGTFVNGRKVEAPEDSGLKQAVVPLHPGDIVQLGETSLRIDIAPHPSGAEMDCTNDARKADETSPDCVVSC